MIFNFKIIKFSYFSICKLYVFFSPELTKLWNFKPDNLEACKGPERDFLPSFDSFFQEAFEQLDPELCIEHQYK